MEGTYPEFSHAIVSSSQCGTVIIVSHKNEEFAFVSIRGCTIGKSQLVDKKSIYLFDGFQCLVGIKTSFSLQRVDSHSSVPENCDIGSLFHIMNIIRACWVLEIHSGLPFTSFWEIQLFLFLFKRNLHVFSGDAVFYCNGCFLSRRFIRISCCLDFNRAFPRLLTLRTNCHKSRS